jgi:hypothetical protein
MRAILVLEEETFLADISSIEEVSDVKDIKFSFSRLLAELSELNLKIDFNLITVISEDDNLTKVIITIDDHVLTFYFGNPENELFEPTLDILKDEIQSQVVIFEKETFSSLKDVMIFIAFIQNSGITNGKIEVPESIKERVKYNGE